MQWCACSTQVWPTEEEVGKPRRSGWETLEQAEPHRFVETSIAGKMNGMTIGATAYSKSKHVVVLA